VKEWPVKVFLLFSCFAKSRPKPALGFGLAVFVFTGLGLREAWQMGL
jgi:hypothetical protein